MRKTLILLILIICQLVFTACENNSESLEYEFKFSSKPIYNDETILSIDKIYNINSLSDKYSFSQVTDIDCDKDNNLYVLSQYDREGTIIVFDENGNYLKTLGAYGDGPNELRKPRCFAMAENNLHIYESFKGIKVWDEDNKYVHFTVVTKQNVRFIKPIDGNYFIFTFQLDPQLTHEIWTLKDLNNKRDLLTFKRSKLTDFSFLPEYALAVDQKNNFYFPESIDSYKIVKYDLNGKPVMSFGREYERNPFSGEAREFFHTNMYQTDNRGNKRELPYYPPIIRKIMVDEKGYIWVVLGEMNYDSGGSDYEVTVDLFNKKGEWLYTIQTPHISMKSKIINNRLYSVTAISKATDPQHINVFDIKYNFEN